jgi:hypothetical protein
MSEKAPHIFRPIPESASARAAEANRIDDGQEQQRQLWGELTDAITELTERLDDPRLSTSDRQQQEANLAHAIQGLLQLARHIIEADERESQIETELPIVADSTAAAASDTALVRLAREAIKKYTSNTENQHAA